MKRRDVLASAALAGLGLRARRAVGQEMPKILRVGIVSPGPRRSSPPFTWVDSRLRELGYIEGRNFTLDFVDLNGQLDRYFSATRDIVARKADVLIAFGPEIALKAAIVATTTIPIVMVAIDYDPVERGYIKNLARPGGTITGIFLQQIELAVKRLQLLKEAFPDAKAVTIFWDGPSAPQWQALQRAAPSLGLDLVGVELTTPPYDYDAALARVPTDYRQVLGVCNSPAFFNDRAKLSQFTLRSRIASMFAWREWVEAGGLISYGPSFIGIARRAIDYVDRIARGAKPADLPVEQPTKFELVINLKAARTLGLNIPTALIARADEVIE